VQTATAYLETLNPEQRRAVEHGAAGGLAAPPLLVIAGAGSGKTNTLAHRVAHLIVEGADPRRILLMTFSRRAASEMTKRVERIARKVMVDSAGIMTDALTWAGTYHGIGARLLREYAEQMPIGRRANDPRRHASFLKSCSACSSGRHGRYRSVPRHAPPDRYRCCMRGVAIDGPIFAAVLREHNF
jgi:superfamily I DNA/RNA helicase